MKEINDRLAQASLPQFDLDKFLTKKILTQNFFYLTFSDFVTSLKGLESLHK